MPTVASPPLTGAAPKALELVVVCRAAVCGVRGAGDRDVCRAELLDQRVADGVKGGPADALRLGWRDVPGPAHDERGKAS